MKCDLCHEAKAIAEYDAPPCEGRDQPLRTVVCEDCLHIPIKYGMAVKPLQSIYKKRYAEIIEKTKKLHAGKYKHKWDKRLSGQTDSPDGRIYDLMDCQKCGAETKRYGITGETYPEFGCSVPDKRGDVNV